MNLRHSFLALLALTMIPAGMVFTSADTAQQNQEFEAILQSYKKPTLTPAKPETIWGKIKAKLAWFNVNRVLGITGVVLLGWMIKRQFFTPDDQKPHLNPFAPKKKELKFRNGYRDRLGAPAAADSAPIAFQLPHGGQVVVEQVAVVEQVGPSCPFHASVNADILAQAEINEKNRDAERAHAKDPQYAGQRVEAAAEHIEKILNGDERPRIDILNAEGVLPALKRSTSEKGWAEASVVQEILAGNAGNAEIVSFQDGVPQHNEAALKQNGVHRVVVAYQGENNVAMGDNAIHYFTVIINRQGNNVRYVIADSLGNADRRRSRAVTRLISHLERNDSSNEGVSHVYNTINGAIRNPGAAAPVRGAAAPRPAQNVPRPPANEADVKKLGANNPPPASAPKPAAPSHGNPATATASATSVGA